jgi:hypothetical protein
MVRLITRGVQFSLLDSDASTTVRNQGGIYHYSLLMAGISMLISLPILYWEGYVFLLATNGEEGLIAR